ncbi:MAG: aminotransferase class I/II-fold pyridoxal phosphate-dependent enzyme [Gemmatimonadetes bacterium]|nr:aminotransferase class I/II-fold pyridoxal phosphate-dependent enzyme [Gemmatimonadota bacterium]
MVPPPPPPSPLESDPDEMRRFGYAVIDALVERQRGLRDDVPWRGGSRRDLEPLLREPCPEEPGDPDAALRRALTEILPRAGRIDHPRFFAFVPSSPTWASVMGDLLATGFNVFQGTWLESAGPSQVELVVLEWFREWIGLPEGAGGLFTSGGSAANLGAVVAAREAAGHPERPSVYFSDQSHSSIERACRIAGFRDDALRRIPSDAAYRIDVAALSAAIARDVAQGRTPVLVSANGGATNTGVVDPLPELADVCEQAETWLHVDAAYGGFAALTPRGAATLSGLGRARSVTLDPHKWFFQPYETGCLLVRDPADLQRAFHVLPEYLQDVELGFEHVNFADRGLQLTRAFRALKVWMGLQVHGRRAHADAVDKGIELGDVAEAALRAAPEIEILSPSSLGIVCFRLRPEADGVPWPEERLEALNRGIQDTIVAEGTAMMSSTRLRGRYALRLCILNYRSTAADVRAVVERVVALGRERVGIVEG